MENIIYKINGKDYTPDELIAWCKSSLEHAEAWEKDIFNFILDWLSDVSYIVVNTSGSTGEPQQIRLEKKRMKASARLSAEYFNMKAGNEVLLCLPARYIAGKMVIVRAFTNGFNLNWVEPTINPLLNIDRGFNLTSFTPMQVFEMLRSTPEKFERIEKVLVGGGPISAVLDQRLRETKNDVFATYGMTETISHVAVRKVNAPGTLFHALPGVKFSIDDDGCLIISAVHLDALGIKTNDMVQLVGPYSFHFLGRRDNVINSGGIKLFPEKIESQISTLMENDFFLWKKADDTLGERMVLCIESEPYNDTDILRLKSSLKLLLNTFEVPKEILFTPKFERTETGKVIRKNYL